MDLILPFGLLDLGIVSVQLKRLNVLYIGDRIQHNDFLLFICDLNSTQ